jgi:hypothetical protein
LEPADALASFVRLEALAKAIGALHIIEHDGRASRPRLVFPKVLE